MTQAVESVDQKIHAITSDTVNVSRNNLKRALEGCEKYLNDLPLNDHKNALDVLVAYMESRNMAMQKALEAFRAEQQEKAQAEAKKRAEEAAAAASTPRLVGTEGTK